MRSGRIRWPWFVAGLASLVWLSVSPLAAADDDPAPSSSVPRPRGFPAGPRRFNPRLGNARELPKSYDPSKVTPPPPSAEVHLPTSAPAPVPTVTPRPAVPVAPAPAPQPVVAPTPRPKARPRPKKPPAPPLPSPSVELTLDAPSPDAPWTIRAKNTGTVPLRMTADARIVALDVTAPSEGAVEHAKAHAKPRSVRCELPADMRPSDDDDRELVVPPGRAYAEKIDPRLFCFGAHESAALVAGASVVARLVGSRDVSVVGPLDDGSVATLATLTELASAAVTIGPTPPPPAKEPHPRTLEVTLPAFVDAERGADANITLTVTNESSSAISTLLRPETVALDVTGPSGIGVTDPSPTVHCAWLGAPPAPIRELFTRLSPKESETLTVLPDAVCPDGTLDQPGLYVIRARLDTRRASGAAVGLHTLNVEIASETTTRVRIRRPMVGTAPPPKPQLEALPNR